MEPLNKNILEHMRADLNNILTLKDRELIGREIEVINDYYTTKAAFLQEIKNYKGFDKVPFAIKKKFVDYDVDILMCIREPQNMNPEVHR